MQNISYHDRKYKVIFSKALLDAIDSALKAKGKILLFLNRKGFATFAFCHACAMPLKCPRCNINLVYHFKNNLLTCHYCSYKIEMPKICPNCNSGYIKFSGIGVEKVESELTRIFPLAKVKVIQGQGEENLEDSDIIVATSSVIKHPKYCFDLIGVLAIDNSLNRVDFRSAEKTFSQLIGLCSLTNKQIFIQSKLINHYIFKALFKKDVNIFYEEELKQRKQLKFSPYSHMVLIKLRGKNESRVESCALKLFDELNAYNKAKEIRVISVNPGQPAKLRGNFYWQVLISIDNIKKLKNFLKIPLKNFLHSGIILTVDVDPL
jgi:primosomal protein N' (replication factor Y)